jgi:hypothetical protein
MIKKTVNIEFLEYANINDGLDANWLKLQIRLKII